LGECRDKALELVGRRPHFHRELQQKLQSRGFPPDEVEEALQEMVRLGLLDDLEHAQALAAGSMSRKGFGPRRIRLELHRRGVEEDVVDTVLARVFEDPEEELLRARAVAERKGLGGQVDKDRLARHLDRKGYSKAVIVHVLRDLDID
jgi:regulatory protein